VHTRVMAPFDTLPWGVLNVVDERETDLIVMGVSRAGFAPVFCTHALSTRTRNRSVRALSGIECTELIQRGLLPNVAAEPDGAKRHGNEA
jgi:hypothetical protein